MLTWHVDYWNYLGWNDPFASKAFTQRQKRYKGTRKPKAFGTPQFFIDNEAVPWTDGAWDQIPGQVDEGSAKQARLAIRAKATLGGGKVAVDIRLERLKEGLEFAKDVGVVPVLYRLKASTDCPAGENEGRTLKEYFIALEAHAPLALDRALEKGVKASFKAPKGLAASDLGVAILVEDSSKMRTLECTSIPVQ